MVGFFNKFHNNVCCEVGWAIVMSVLCGRQELNPNAGLKHKGDELKEAALFCCKH